jgi:plastocyanin
MTRTVLVLAVALASLSPYIASAATPRTLVIGVDHLDPANQQPERGRIFEYTDFFSRSVKIHSGDTLDFRTAANAFHVVAIARDEAKARDAYPVLLLDRSRPPAPGTGLPRIQLGPSNGSITAGSELGGGTIGGPVDFPPGPCGLIQIGQAPCAFHGGADVESQGGVPGIFPEGTDWEITFNGVEPGTFAMFCYIHPGMRGEITVVPDSNLKVTTQQQIDAASQNQFLQDRSQAIDTEHAANTVRFTGQPGKRTYQVAVGISAANQHVAIDEMLPKSLNLTRGDAVAFKWLDEHSVHTVGFPNSEPPLPQAFDFGVSPPEADPGNAPAGTLLTRPDVMVDSGFLVGKNYHLQPSTQSWGVTTGPGTAAGAYAYMCTVHDFMQGALTVSP